MVILVIELPIKYPELLESPGIAQPKEFCSMSHLIQGKPCWLVQLFIILKTLFATVRKIFIFVVGAQTKQFPTMMYFIKIGGTQRSRSEILGEVRMIRKRNCGGPRAEGMGMGMGGGYAVNQPMGGMGMRKNMDMGQGVQMQQLRDSFPRS